MCFTSTYVYMLLIQRGRPTGSDHYIHTCHHKTNRIRFANLVTHQAPCNVVACFCFLDGVTDGQHARIFDRGLVGQFLVKIVITICGTIPYKSSRVDH